MGRSTVPRAVREATDRRLIDTLAAISGGYALKEPTLIADYVEERYADGGTSLLDGSGRQSTVQSAALANGVATNALDIDDGCVTSLGHPAAVVFPQVLAAAEATDAFVGELLDAILPAYEIAVRTAVGLHDATGCYTGSGSWCAAGIATVRGLDADQTGAAVELAGFNGPLTPIMRNVANPGSGLTKDGIGLGEYVGAVALETACRGLHGSGAAFAGSNTTISQRTR